VKLAARIGAPGAEQTRQKAGVGGGVIVLKTIGVAGAVVSATRSRGARACLVAAPILVASIVACSQSLAPFVIQVNPDSATVAEGRAVSLVASANRPISRDAPFSWVSSDGSVAGVDFRWDEDSGTEAFVRPWKPGKAEVRAYNYSYSADGHASAQITVFAVSAKSLGILPNTATIDSGGYVLLTPLVRDSVDVALLRPGFQWSSSDPEIAQATWISSWGFGGNGVCRIDGLRSGEVTITAQVEGLLAQARVTVRNQ
jgi:uncharacterized protein YjdB